MSTRCRAKTKNGGRCRNKTLMNFCAVHLRAASEEAVVKIQRWYRSNTKIFKFRPFLMNQIDPFTLEPVRGVRFYIIEAPNHIFQFEVRTLMTYFSSVGKLENPFTRKKLDVVEIHRFQRMVRLGFGVDCDFLAIWKKYQETEERHRTIDFLLGELEMRYGRTMDNALSLDDYLDLNFQLRQILGLDLQYGSAQIQELFNGNIELQSVEVHFGES